MNTFEKALEECENYHNYRKDIVLSARDKARKELDDVLFCMNCNTWKNKHQYAHECKKAFFVVSEGHIDAHFGGSG